MYQFDDIIGFYIRMVDTLKVGKISPHSPLEQVVLESCKDCFAYIDNRRDAKKNMVVIHGRLLRVNLKMKNNLKIGLKVE